MNRRKALSLLLAASMVFSMNSIAFAAEETAADNAETIETQVVYKNYDEFFKAIGQSDNGLKAQSENNKVKEDAKKAGITITGITDAVVATGSKFKSSYFTGTKKDGFDILVSANGYRTSVKKVKITSKAKFAGEEVTYKISALNGAQYVTKYNPDTRRFENLLPKDAKEGFKAIKNSLSTIKGYEFKAVVIPQYLEGAVSDNYVKSLGKTVSGGDITGNNGSGYDLRSRVVVTTKNGTPNKVQVIEPKWLKTTSNSYGNDIHGYTDNNGNFVGYYAKLKLRTLKKNKDYTLSGNTVVIDNSKVFFTMADDLKDFEAKW